MRSLYAKVLLWSFGTLMFSLVAFLVTSFYLSRHDVRASLPFRLNTYLLDEAVHAYEAGGSGALAATLERQERYFWIEMHLTNTQGMDLVSKAMRPDVIALSPDEARPRKIGGRIAVVMSDAAHRYRLIVYVPPPAFDITATLPYYLLILLAVAGLCWLLAVNLVKPLRQLAHTVDRFGAGDLVARVDWRRRDEIGDLAGAFNQMAQRLQTSLTAERRLLQDISHELRSPLARLSFAAELTRTATDRNAAAARLRKEIDRLTDLVSGLIQVTRAEGESSERNLGPVALDQVVQDVTQDCELEAAARHCRIETNVAGSVSLRADPELLRRAVENVLRNAIRYSPEATAVEVRVDNSDSAATVSIRDYGPGVPEEMLPKIFSPFFRVDSSRDAATGGIGLGLAIAQRAVMLHHGQITARNAGPGLMVTITLPTADHPA